VRIALYQPDIPQNTGTILRMAACFEVPVDIIAPAGFDISDRALKRAGLDYLDQVEMTRHQSWEAFVSWATENRHRIVLLTTRASTSHTEFNFQQRDILLMGRESAGVPQTVHDTADERVKVPIKPGLRSLNLAVATAIATAEGLRQLNSFPAS